MTREISDQRRHPSLQYRFWSPSHLAALGVEAVHYQRTGGVEVEVVLKQMMVVGFWKMTVRTALLEELVEVPNLGRSK